MSGRRFIALLIAGCAAIFGQVALASTPAAAVAPINSHVGTITNGVAWNDTAGNYITAHLGSSFHVTTKGVTTYYWCGVNWNTADSTPSSSPHTFEGVQCYTSSNLATWTYTGEPALAVDPTNPMLDSTRNIERPKVIYNASTGKYVMWFHDDGPSYGEWKIGVAKSSTPAGPYTWVSDGDAKGFRGCGTGTGDMSLFVDDDGSAYIVHTTSANADIKIQKLSDDYTACASTAAVASHLGGAYEAPQLIKVNGTYFLFDSGKKFWAPTQGVYRTASQLGGVWTAPTAFGSRYTAVSQGDDIIPVVGSLGTTYVMMADRLQGAAGADLHWNVNQSQYVWLPLTFNGADVRLDYLNSWSIDTTTGLWSTPDPQPCDLTQFVDSESGYANNVSVYGGPGALTPQVGTWQVIPSQFPTGNTTNEVYQHATTESSYSFETADNTTYTDYYVQAYAALDTSSAGEVSVAGRVSQTDRNHFYTLALNGQGWAIRLNNGGVWSTLASGTQFPGKGTINLFLLRLVMNGSSISGWLSNDNGTTFTQLGATTDATLTGGSFGVGSSGAATGFDNIGACVIGTARAVAAPAVTAHGTNRQLLNASGGTVPCSTAGSTSGSPLTGSSCAIATFWSWEQFPENTDRSGRLLNSSGLCLDVANAVVTVGAAVTVGPCGNWAGSQSQRWLTDDLGNGNFRLRNSASPAGQPLCVVTQVGGGATLGNCSSSDVWQQFSMS
jgi:hypothetical protein